VLATGSGSEVAWLVVIEGEELSSLGRMISVKNECCVKLLLCDCLGAVLGSGALLLGLVLLLLPLLLELLLFGRSSG